LFACAIIFSVNVAARNAVAIIPHDNIPVVTGTHNVPTDQQVADAINAAATAKNWTTTSIGNDKLLATLVVRHKHTIVVEITYAPDKYSVAYKDSVNMKYGIAGAQFDGFKQTSPGGYPEIHPFYNDWVKELIDTIQVELLKL
jgi:hypothetical protein